METVTALVRSIFHKESLDECSLEELQAMARQYSYFTPVQFLLAEKLRTTDENLYKEQLQKLSLHFNNPLWLDHLLNSYKTEEPVVSAIAEIPETGNEEIIETVNENISQQATVAIEQGVREQIIDEVETNTATERFQPLGDEFSGKDKEPAEHLSENNTDVETENPDPLKETNQPSISVSPLPDLDKEPAETELTFQPYHTVDYFASQGIKFIPEEKPVDRFGKQLKSFTEWLKTMKRLPQSEIPKIADLASDEKVEQMAEHSIDRGEIITETMAEVWIKQGNREKAIETYNKLSLLNPDKSAYFASLAEQLKNS